MDNPRTVSDTKRAFYSLHTRPINSVYRRVVEELLVEIHLLTVNVNFRPDPIYMLGVVTAFDRFMEAYQPPDDRASLFNALCRSCGGDPALYRSIADRLERSVSALSFADLVQKLEQPDSWHDFPEVQDLVQRLQQGGSFKYSRLFGIGVFTLLEKVEAEVFKADPRRSEALQQVSQALKLTDDRLQKDLEFYRSSLEKMRQAQVVMADILAASRRQRERRTEDKETVANEASAEQTPSGS